MDAVNNSSVLITGGRGFLGRAATKLLQRTGYAGISPDASSLPVAHDQQSVREVICDTADGQALHQVFEAGAIDVILHLAAGSCRPRRNLIRSVRQRSIFAGAMNLLEMAGRFGVRRVILGSSLSVY